MLWGMRAMNKALAVGAALLSALIGYVLFLAPKTAHESPLTETQSSSEVQPAATGLTDIVNNESSLSTTNSNPFINPFTGQSSNTGMTLVTFPHGTVYAYSQQQGIAFYPFNDMFNALTGRHSPLVANLIGPPPWTPSDINNLPSFEPWGSLIGAEGTMTNPWDTSGDFTGSKFMGAGYYYFGTNTINAIPITSAEMLAKYENGTFAP